MTGPSPAAKRRRSPIGSMGNSRSAKMIAASTSSSSTGCKVTVAARSGRLQISRIPCRSRIWRYCRRYRPACRINQTGLTSVGRRRQASRKRLVMGATRMGNQNKTITNCLNLGLIFGSAARFFRPFDQKIDPAVSIRVAIPLKMQLGDVPEAEPDAQLVTQVVPGVVQRSQRLPLALLIPAGRDLDVGMPAIRAEMHLGNVHFQNPRILHLEPDDFGKLFPDSLRDPQCAPLIHKATAPLRSRLSNASHSRVASASSEPSKAAASSSTERSTFSAKIWLDETVTAATVARCQRSWESISATATLNLCRSRFFKLWTTFRLSFSECEFSSRNSSVRTPTTAICSGENFARDALRYEGFNHVGLLHVAEVLQRDAAFHPALNLAHIIFETP